MTSTSALSLRLAARSAFLLSVLLAAPAFAQTAGSWQVLESPDDLHSFGTTVADGENATFLSGANVPAASDPAWSSASSNHMLRWTGGKSVSCRAGADYSYVQTAVFPAAGDRYTISFLNVDDAARVTVYNEDNPGGLDAPNGIVGLRERTTVDVTPALLAGATNRVVITVANVCGPSSTLHLDLEVEAGEPMESGASPGAQLAQACKGALQTLLANNYDFATTPDPNAVRSGASMSFAAAYAQFEEVAPVCQMLLEEPEAYVPAGRMGGLNALVASHQAQIASDLAPNLSFTDRIGYLNGGAGVASMGSRAVSLCPQQHRIQFSCDVAAERVAISARLLIEYLDFLGGTSEETMTIGGTEVRTGDIQVTLEWDTRVADLDLFVTDPSGARVGWDNPRVASGGLLDVDAQAGCQNTDSTVENIIWEGTPPSGTFQVIVDHYQQCSGSGPVSYTATLRRGGQVVETWTGSVGLEDDNTYTFTTN